MEAYTINENRILEMLKEVSTAKRVATMVGFDSTSHTINSIMFDYISNAILLLIGD